MTEPYDAQDKHIFRQPWWLDAVAPGRWGEAVCKKGGEQAARLPYVVEKKAGMTFLTMPPLTQSLGPWIRKTDAKYVHRLSEEKDLMTELIDNLPRHDKFTQNFHFSTSNWLPFYWRGFSQTTRYTYRIEDLTDPEEIWKGFAKNARGYIRKAEKALAVRTDLGIDQFLKINALTYSRQGMKVPYSDELVRRLDAACEQRNARKMVFAEDASGRMYAAMYLVWDSDSAYNIMLGSDPEVRSSGATSLLVWEALRFAASVTKAFDFEGSMIEPLERFFRSFGATQVPYFRVSRLSRRMRFLHAGRQMFEALLGKS